MILPGSYVLSLTLLVLGMICWGSWANTYKSTGPRWRFELFYFDFAVGVVLASLIAAFTFGSLGWDGFSFLDDIRNAGKRQDMYGFVAGCIFNLANMLLVAAISLSGMSVAFPVVFGVALVVGVIWGLFLNPGANPLLLAAGCIAMIGAVSFAVVAYRNRSLERLAAAPPETKAPGKGRPVKKTFSYKGIIIPVISGVLMGTFYPLLMNAKTGDNSLGPYSAGFVFAGGIFCSTVLFNLFFMNLPVEGKPVELASYFRGGAKQHGLGVLGGILWYTGAITTFIVARAEGVAQVTPLITHALTNGAAIIGALWGVIVWREFAGSEGRIKSFVAVTLFLFILGMAAVSMA